MAAVVPDGIVCFFPSYAYMEMMIAEWQTAGIVRRLQVAMESV